MSNLKNKVSLIGNVGNDPEITTLDSGKKVAKISLATNDSYKNANGEKVTTTEWHNLVVWNKLAEIVEKFVKKGSELAIEGKLTYSNKEVDGVKKYFTSIVVRELLMLDKNNS